MRRLVPCVFLLALAGAHARAVDLANANRCIGAGQHLGRAREQRLPLALRRRGGATRARALRGGGADEQADAEEEPSLPFVVVGVTAVLAMLLALGLVQAAQLLAWGINALIARAGVRAAPTSQAGVLAALWFAYMASALLRRVRFALLARARPAAADGAPAAPRAPRVAASAPRRPTPFAFLDSLSEKLSDVDGPLRARLRAQIRWYEPNSTRVSFADVAGCDEAVAEVRDIVDFLKHPERYNALGARMPRGVLLEGPPGTGKTLLAKALAAEAGVAFASVAGPTIGAQRFAGVSSAFVAELFKNASARAPCIIYIDELDSLGAARAQGAGDVSRDKADGLNSLLTAMDGFDTPGAAGAAAPTAARAADGRDATNATAAPPPAVVVLASTNRADILDPALLRPGRFDRRVTMRLPGGAGRAQILRVCARSRALDAGALAALDEIAARTGGLSGAQLENVVNEAAIGAGSRAAAAVERADLEAALDKVTVGLRLRPTDSAAARELAAVHEAGHALVAIAAERWLAAGGRPLDVPPTRVTQVTILPRAGAGGVSAGHTAFRADDAKLEAGVRTARDLLAEMAVTMGGRMAEEVTAGRAGVTSGAEADLERAWHLARAFVGRWGMSALGPIHVARRGEEGPSESADGRVAAEEHRLMRLAAEAAGAVLRANRPRHAAVVRALLANETLCRADLDALLDAHEPAVAAWRPTMSGGGGGAAAAARRVRQLPGSAAFDALSKRSLEMTYE